MSYNRIRRASALGVALLVAATAVACGSSSHSSVSNATTAGTSASATTASPTASDTSGTAIRAVVIADVGTTTATDDLAGIKIGVAAVNAAGGIKGHPLEITPCTDNEDPNGAGACARNAASNSKILAVVGSGTSFGSNVDPILTSGGTASIGNSTYTAADFICKVCFNDSAGDFDTIGSALAAVKVLHALRIGIPYIDLPSGAGLAPLVGNLIKPLGGQTVGVVPIPVTAADVTPQAAAEGAAKPDAIIDGLTTSLLSKFIHAYRSQGFTTPFLVSGGVYDPGSIASQLSGVNSDLYVDAEFDHASPGYQTFLADKQKYAPSYPYTDDEVLRTYFAVKEFAYAADHAASLTKQGILAEMNSLSAYSSDGLLPPINYTKAQTGLGGEAPRVFADHIYLYKYENGKFVTVGAGQPINVFTGGS